jgi:hypothetical protein
MVHCFCFYKENLNKECAEYAVQWLYESLSMSGVTHISDLLVLLGNIIEELDMLETRVGRTDVVSLSHFEVLAEVLISAPPVSVDHTETLVSADLMEVSVSHIILMSISGHTSVGVSLAVFVVDFSNVPSPFLGHVLLLVFADNVEEERLVQVVAHKNPDDSNSVLSTVGVGFPVHVTNGVLEESSNVLEGSPSLSFISRFLLVVNKFGEITVSFFSESSKNKDLSVINFSPIDNSGNVIYLPANHISTLIDVRDTVEEAFNTGKFLSKVGLRVLTIVEILCHITIN